MKTSSWFLKLLNWIAWASGGIGLIFIILGIFQVVFGFVLYLAGANRIGAGRLMVDTEIINFFIASVSFFSITIIVLLLGIQNQFKKG